MTSRRAAAPYRASMHACRYRVIPTKQFVRVIRCRSSDRLGAIVCFSFCFLKVQSRYFERETAGFLSELSSKESRVYTQSQYRTMMKRTNASFVPDYLYESKHQYQLLDL